MGRVALSETFVGREAEMGALCAHFDETLLGKGRFLLLTGDPGIGKTRTAEEVGNYARSRGARVLWGRCFEGDGAPPLWPWSQILRAALAAIADDRLARTLGDGGTDVARIVPSLRARLPELPPPDAIDSDAVRTRVFESIAQFVRNLAGEQPLLVVIDDIQGADPMSVSLLDFLVRTLTTAAPAALLVLGSCRTAAVAHPSPLSDMLTALATEGKGGRLSLQGLSVDEVGRFVETHVGVAPPPEVTAKLHDATGGNPLFVKEFAHLCVSNQWAAEPTWNLTIPPTVTAAIQRRLANLSPPCRAALEVASAIGRDVPVAILETVAANAAAGSRIRDIVDEGVRHSILVPGHDHETYRFAHALTRDALYARLSAPKRRQIHRSVAQALEAAPDVDDHLGELAHHLLQAGSPADLAASARFAHRAAERALNVFAYEEAVRLCELALAALDRLEGDPDRFRCGLLLTLAHAQKGAVDTSTSRSTFEQALALARTLRAPELFARAVLGTRWRLDLGNTDPGAVRLLEEALTLLGPGDSVLRPRLLAGLADELQASLAPEMFERSEDLSREAVAVARRVGDPEALCSAVRSWYHCAWLAENLDERLAAVNELVELGRTHHSDVISAEASHLRLSALFELGDVVEVERELERLAAYAGRLRMAHWLYFVPCWHSTLSTFRGQFADAIRYARQALELGQRAKEPRAIQMFAIQEGFPLVLQGTVPAAYAEIMKQSVADMNWNWGLRTALICLAHVLGDEETARRHYEALAARDFADVPHTNRLLSLAVLSDFAVHFGDTRRAALLYARLLPFKTRNVPDPGWGSVARFVGLTAAATGRLEEAASHFEHAVAHNIRMGARPHLALTQADYARLLLQRDGPGDRSRAAALLQEAVAAARELGMQPLAAKAEALQQRHRLL